MVAPSASWSLLIAFGILDLFCNFARLCRFWRSMTTLVTIGRFWLLLTTFGSEPLFAASGQLLVTLGAPASAPPSPAGRDCKAASAHPVTTCLHLLHPHARIRSSSRPHPRIRAPTSHFRSSVRSPHVLPYPVDAFARSHIARIRSSTCIPASAARVTSNLGPASAQPSSRPAALNRASFSENFIPKRPETRESKWVMR